MIYVVGHGMSCVYKTANNPFWKTVIAYASAVTNNNCAINDLVFSDCIHCQSSNGAGPYSSANAYLEKWSAYGRFIIGIKSLD